MVDCVGIGPATGALAQDQPRITNVVVVCVCQLLPLLWA